MLNEFIPRYYINEIVGLSDEKIKEILLDIIYRQGELVYQVEVDDELINESAKIWEIMSEILGDFDEIARLIWGFPHPSESMELFLSEKSTGELYYINDDLQHNFTARKISTDNRLKISDYFANSQEIELKNALSPIGKQFAKEHGLL